MKRMLRVVSGVVLGVLVLAGALFATSRLHWPTRAQQRALAEMTTPLPVPAGKNAFADVWLLRYDLTETERTRIAGEDVERFNRRGVPGFAADGTVSDETPGFTSVAEGRYPQEKLHDPGRVLCNAGNDDCLGKVRAEPARIDAILVAHAGLLERTRDALERNDYLRTPFRLTYDTPLAIAGLNDGMRLMRTAAARAYVRGETVSALAETCRATAAWRHWMRHPDLLLDLMMGDAALRGWLALQGQMLASLPADVSLPAACASLREPPPPGGASLCQVARREFAFARSLLDLAGDGKAMRPGESGWLDSLGYRPDATLAMVAEARAWHCGETARRQLLADQPAIPAAPRSSWRLECVANWFGCRLVAMEYAGMIDYQHRLQDQRARLNLMATLLWLREQPRDGRTLAARVRARPATLRQGRDIQVVEGRLRIPLFEQRDGAYWELDVPAELR
ncbi:hypothetical protein ACWKWK_15995 [Pseudoxanthomonas beigongshangi]